MGEILYNQFAKYLSGYLNFMSQKKEWDQPQQQTKSQFVDQDYCFCLEKAKWKHFMTMSDFQRNPAR